MYTVYSKDNCKYCLQAVALLTLRGLEFTEVKLTDDAAKTAMIDRVIATGAAPPRSVPQIFEGDAYIGGFDQLAASLKVTV